MYTTRSTTVIYARKSTESEDRQALSIDSQIHALMEHVTRAGLHITGVFREAQSAKEPGRPVFEEMLSFIEDNQISSILCWKLDRLARNPIDGARIIWALEKNKISQVHTPQQSYSNSGNDKFWMQLEFGMAKKYVDDLSDNTKRGLKAKLNLGWRPGLPPIGYLNDTISKTIVADPESFESVRKIWEHMLSGNHTASQVHRLIQVDHRVYSQEREISKSNVYSILRNPFYYGLIKYGGNFYPGSHPMMVSKEEFDRVQILLKCRGTPRPKKLDFCYRGLIRCAVCRRWLTAERKTNRHGHKYIYYHCPSRGRVSGCDEPSIEERELEQQLFSMSKSLQPKQSQIERRNVINKLQLSLVLFKKKIISQSEYVRSAQHAQNLKILQKGSSRMQGTGFLANLESSVRTQFIG